MRPIRPSGTPRALTRIARTVSIVAAVLITPAAPGQLQGNPVYPDDSTLASDTLAGLGDLIDRGNDTEAIRALQRLLDDEGDRVLASDDDADAFLSVRQIVHDRVLAAPALLERYRDLEGPAARRMLEEGRWDEVERTRMLTTPGFEATLRVAQTRLEEARFESALRAIAQLEAHPDRRTGADAARLLAQIARYVDRDEVWRRAERWAAEAGLPAPERGAVSSPAPPIDVRSAIPTRTARPVPGIQLQRLVPTPLKSVPLTPVGADLMATEPGDRRVNIRTTARSFAWAMPTVVGDDVYVNDGTTISAWDRFTLRTKWRVRTDLDAGTNTDRRAAARRAVGRRLEDNSTVTVADHLVLATTGHAIGGLREGDGRVRAIHRETGRVAWAVDISTLDPQLSQASVRGPILVDGDTVIVAARKSVRARRLVSLYLVGLDLETGALRWTRLLASAGSLPFQQFGRLSEGGVVERGVVYRVDEIGVVAAVEAQTGRPLWVRRLPPHDLYASDLRPPWTTSVPVVHRDSLVVLSPDRREILRIDQRSGRITARRDAEELAAPYYLVRVGDWLGAVGSDRVAVVDLGRFDTGLVRLSGSYANGVTGRAVAAGENILLPLSGGVALIDPRAPAARPAIPVDRTGNALALEGQLMIVDNTHLHSYLVWEIAAGLLEGRMNSAPDDPGPAATFAELAYRAGRADRIIPAVDAALSAIERNPADPQNQAASDRLFNSVLAMIESSQSSWFAETAADPARPDARPPTAPLDPLVAPAVPRIRELDVLDGLADRLGRIASSPEQQVSHRMVVGRLREAEGEPSQAIDSYQEVLLDESLAPATWRGPQLTVRADLEAARRIRRLIAENGTGVYRTFDLEAGLRADSLPEQPSGVALEALAKRYPGASVTPILWARAAAAHNAGDRSHAGIRALRAATTSARLLGAAGQQVDQSEIGAIAGTIIMTLARNGRDIEAERALDDVLDAIPGLALSDAGASLDPDVLRVDFGAPRRVPVALPRVGRDVEIDPRPQLVRGRVLSPLGQGSSRPLHDRVLLVGEVEAGFELTLLHHAPPETTMQTAWTRPIDAEPFLLRTDATSALVYWAHTETSGSLERIDLESGEPVWETGTFETIIAEVAPDPARGAEFITPLDGRVSPDQLVVSLDDQTVVIVDRSGRAAGLDAMTGAKLWTMDTGITRVHDCDVSSGLFVVGGLGADRPGGGGAAEMSPRIAAFDARSGEAMNRVEEIAGATRWLRLTPGGDLLAGVDTGVVSINVVEGRVNWIMSDQASMNTYDAWVFDDRLFLLAEDRSLWLGSVSTGRLRDVALDDRGRLELRSRIEARRIGDSIAFTSSSGVAIFSRAGELVGIDTIDSDGELVPAAMTESLLATLEPRGRSRSGMYRYRLHLLSSESAKLVAKYDVKVLSQPTSIRAINDALLISAGNATLVIDAPARSD